MSQVLAADAALQGTDPSPCCPGTHSLVGAQMSDGMQHNQTPCCLPSSLLEFLTHPHNKPQSGRDQALREKS